MANHPITSISPIQIIQTSIAQNTGRLTTISEELPSSGAMTSSASLSTAGNTSITNVHLMQSNDATTFVYGSTPSNQSPETSSYTTVDDAAKLATLVATDYDVLDEVKREEEKKKKQLLSKKSKQEEEKKNDDLPPLEEPHYSLKSTMVLASHGPV